MIIGVGIDLVNTARIERLIEKYHTTFLNRVFTSYEQAYASEKFSQKLTYGKQFAAKEAFAKATGWGIGSKIGWKDVETRHDLKGKPVLYLSLAVEDLCLRYFGTYISTYLSLSDEDPYAQACVILCKKQEK